MWGPLIRSSRSKAAEATSRLARLEQKQSCWNNIMHSWFKEYLRSPSWTTMVSTMRAMRSRSMCSATARWWWKGWSPLPPEPPLPPQPPPPWCPWWGPPGPPCGGPPCGCPWCGPPCPWWWPPWSLCCGPTPRWLQLFRDHCCCTSGARCICEAGFLWKNPGSTCLVASWDWSIVSLPVPWDSSFPLVAGFSFSTTPGRGAATSGCGVWLATSFSTAPTSAPPTEADVPRSCGCETSAWTRQVATAHARNWNFIMNQEENLLLCTAKCWSPNTKVYKGIEWYSFACLTPNKLQLHTTTNQHRWSKRQIKTMPVVSMASYKRHGTSNEFDSSSLLPSESHCVMEFLS